MKLAELECHLRTKVAFSIAKVVRIAFGSILPCTRSPASRAIAKSKRGRFGPSANNWKFLGHKADTQAEKRYLGHPAVVMAVFGLKG